MEIRRTALLVFLAGLSTGLAASPQAVAGARPVRQYSIEEFLSSTTIAGASFSPDGSRILVSSNQTGIFNAYALSVYGGKPRQLTHSTTDAIYANAYFPEDERIIYSSDRGGDEHTHVYVRELDGRAIDLTPGDRLKAAFAGWAQDDGSFFITTNERDPRYFDLYEVTAARYTKTLLFKNEGGFNVAAVSPGKRYIALRKTETRANSYVMVHDVQTGETREMMPHEGDAVCIPLTFTRDGKSLRCLTDLDHEFLYLVNIELETGEQSVVEKLDWDVSFSGLSKHGKYRVVRINRDGRTELRIYDEAAGTLVRLPKVPSAGIASATFSKDESAVAFYIHGGRTPGDLFYYKLGSPRKPKQLTWRLSASIDPSDLVEPQVVRFTSYDGTTIPGILYKPHQADKAAKAPALVYVHGGPGGQTRVNYDPLIQFLVNHGYVVYGINNRGSSGYGKTFFAMDDLKHGDADLDDCVASKRMLAGTGYVDPDRIGVIGASYGGYMVCAALAFRPEAFKAGVNIFGVTNWVRTLKSIPSWWEATRNALYKELGDPFEQEAYLHKISPLFHAENIIRPLLVLQGANDVRVLQVESDEMVAALRANNVPVEYVVFDDEGHGFRKKKNQIRGYKAVLKFLDTYLKGI